MTTPAGPVLRDIHLPPEPSWWPPAPGWWILFVLAMGVLGFMFYRQFKDEIGPPREALRKLLGGEE